MSEELSYAFEELKKVLFQENCKEVVILSVMKKFNMSLQEAEEITKNAFNMWSDAYVE